MLHLKTKDGVILTILRKNKIRNGGNCRFKHIKFLKILFLPFEPLLWKKLILFRNLWHLLLNLVHQLYILVKEKPEDEYKFVCLIFQIKK